MRHGFFNYGSFANKPFLETNYEIEKFLITLTKLSKLVYKNQVSENNIRLKNRSP
jgi:hypothetical protein